jgi:hypothetical protein
MPPNKNKHAPDNPEQSKRFINMAREVGVDESPKAFERAFNKVMGAKPPSIKQAPRDKT